MSILGKIVEKVIPYVVTSDPVINTLDKVTEKAKDKLEESANNKSAKLFKKEPGTEILVFDCQSNTMSHKLSESLVDRFNIYGENQKIKYTVKGKKSSKKRQLEVFDAWGRYIGLLKEKLYAHRGPFSLEAAPIDFSVEIYGRKYGKIKSTGGIINRKFKIDFFGWNIKGNVLSGNYSVVKGKEEIARISRKWGTYVLTFFDIQNELLLLMIVIALYSDSAPDKSEVRKDTWERKRSRSLL